MLYAGEQQKHNSITPREESAYGYRKLACEGKHAFKTLQRALWKQHLFETDSQSAIQSDNGPRLISHVFREGQIKLF